MKNADKKPIGLVLLDKPEGVTSFKAVAMLRRIYGEKRIGHTGTLDPMATGVLPVLIGRATRLSELGLNADKRYTATIRLGITTDTLDITGTVLSETESKVSDEQLKAALEHFKGEQLQVPPMYSAISKGGIRLYDLARQGIEVEREKRKINILEINLLERNGDEFKIDVLCSKGTYIRSLADDLGKFLGCGATLTALRRTATGGFSIDACATVEQIEKEPEKHLISAENVVSHFKKITISEKQKTRFINGGALDKSRVKFSGANDGELFRVCFGDEFLGLAVFNEEMGVFSPKCLI